MWQARESHPADVDGISNTQRQLFQALTVLWGVHDSKLLEIQREVVLEFSPDVVNFGQRLVPADDRRETETWTCYDLHKQASFRSIAGRTWIHDVLTNHS